MRGFATGVGSKADMGARPVVTVPAWRAPRPEMAGLPGRDGGRTEQAEDEDMEHFNYLSDVPKSVPPGKIVVHNNVRPTRQLGMRGFRAWLVEPSPQYEICPCEWAPGLDVHYRVRGATQ